MAEHTEITVGMPVFGSDGHPLGVVEAVDAAALTVGTLQIPRSAVGAVSAGAVHLRVVALAPAARAGDPEPIDADATAGGQLVVPLAEERLVVGTREVSLGEVEIRKRVVEETVMQPVTLRREIVEVVHRDAEGNEIGAQE